MFGDLFGGVTVECLNQSNQAHAINYLTLAIILIEKGIISEDEIEKTRVQATHLVEQEWARKREDADKEFDEKHPGLRQKFAKVLGTDASM